MPYSLSVLHFQNHQLYRPNWHSTKYFKKCLHDQVKIWCKYNQKYIKSKNALATFNRNFLKGNTSKEKCRVIQLGIDNLKVVTNKQHIICTKIKFYQNGEERWGFEALNLVHLCHIVKTVKVTFSRKKWTPSHWSLEVRNFLNTTFNKKW